ncbi:MAG: aminopeptidase [Chitinophagaceae bacterium]|nr:aminopeptidase [Chitinophagaceae bacterium]
MKFSLLPVAFVISCSVFAQPVTLNVVSPDFNNVKVNPATTVKNQAMTGTCWCFSTTSLVESEAIRTNQKSLDLSEMFTVRNIYLEKAKNYVLRVGKAQFGEGGLGHDMIRAIATYGAEPESVYSGLVNGEKTFNHQAMVSKLQAYLDSVIKVQPVKADWIPGYTAILDEYMGAAPGEFEYEGKKYTPLTFAKDVVHFNMNDYVSITSFTHQPYYSSFILQVPDNFANGSFYNLPVKDMIDVVANAVKNGYTVSWDADVSNNGFRQDKGLALYLDPAQKYKSADLTPDTQEQPWSVETRQHLYENLTTQDDHLMHLTGYEESKSGKKFFLVKNSWGSVGPFGGYINVSESYFAINTISVVVPKAALSKEVLAKLQIQ